MTGNGLVDVDVSACCTDDLILAVYTGSSVNALTPVVADGPGRGGVARSSSRSWRRRRIGSRSPVQLETDASSFDLDWDGQALPPNDDFANATPMVGDAGWLLDQTNEYAVGRGGRARPRRPVTEGDRCGTSGRRPRTATRCSRRRCSRRSTSIVVAVYTGSAVDALTEVATSTPATVSHTRRLEFPVLGGRDVPGGGRRATRRRTPVRSISRGRCHRHRTTTSTTRSCSTSGAAIAVGTTEGATRSSSSRPMAACPGRPRTRSGTSGRRSGTATPRSISTRRLRPDDWASVVAVYTGSQLGLPDPGRIRQHLWHAPRRRLPGRGRHDVPDRRRRSGHRRVRHVRPRLVVRRRTAARGW